MKTFNITIECTVKKVMKVEARTEDEARDLAYESFNKVLAALAAEAQDDATTDIEEATP